MNDAWRAARRILAVRLDATGDVLMTGPALRALKESAPGRHVTLLTSSAGAAAARLMPEVDDVIEYVAPWMKPAAGDDPAEHLKLIERLRPEAFDAVPFLDLLTEYGSPWGVQEVTSA